MRYCSYLVRKNPSSSYLLRIQNPKDLREYFRRNQFKISLNSGIHSQSLLFAKVLYLEVQSISQPSFISTKVIAGEVSVEFDN